MAGPDPAIHLICKCPSRRGPDERTMPVSSAKADDADSTFAAPCAAIRNPEAHALRNCVCLMMSMAPPEGLNLPIGAIVTQPLHNGAQIIDAGMMRQDLPRPGDDRCSHHQARDRLGGDTEAPPSPFHVHRANGMSFFQRMGFAWACQRRVARVAQGCDHRRHASSRAFISRAFSEGSLAATASRDGGVNAMRPSNLR